MRHQPHSPHRPSGFAYLWTLMLIAFLGVGLTVAADLYATATRRDKERELLFIGHQFRTAIERYYTAAGAGGQNQYPLTLEDLLKDGRFANPKRHLRRLYTDPTTGKAEWALILQQGRIVGVHSLSVERPVKQDRFDDDDLSLRHKGQYAEWLFTYPADLFTPQQGGQTLPTAGKPFSSTPGQN